MSAPGAHSSKYGNLLITKFDDINLLPLGTFNSDLKATSKYNDHCSKQLKVTLAKTDRF